MKRWLKTWGALVALIVAFCSLGVSAYSLYISKVQYEEVTKPYALHSEINDRLIMLDSRIERTQKNIQDAGITVKFQSKVIEASQLRDRAEIAWNAGIYEEADSLINKAYDILGQVVVPTNWSLIGGIVGAVIVIATLSLVVTGHKKNPL
jgi:uncharacterized membrane protein